MLARAFEVVRARGSQRVAILQPRVGLVSQTENKRVFAASVGLRIVFYRCVNLIFLFCLSILKFLDKRFRSSANAGNPNRITCEVRDIITNFKRTKFRI